MRRFQVSTRRSGIRRVIKVRVYDTTAELQAAVAVFIRQPVGMYADAGAR